MTTTRYDVIGIGNAIVDVIARAEDDFLVQQKMHKGGMALIDEPRAESIYDAMGPAVEISGGSAANTIVGVAGFGARAAFVGKVKDDELGRAFAHDIRAAGVAFDTPPAADGPSTARCYVMVTPDGERTMNTFLGAAQDLHPADVDPAAIAASAITYLEGYLWDPPHAKEAFRKAAKIAHDAGRKVALTLSDPAWVALQHDAFKALLPDVDILLGNETEALELTGESSLEAAAAVLADSVEVVALTRGPAGAIASGGGEIVSVGAEPVAKVEDTTGAGDLFAAGFLLGLARQRPLEDCLRLGALAAAEVISHIGARPQTMLATLAAARGLGL